jgi:hypothetical protein
MSMSRYNSCCCVCIRFRGNVLNEPFPCNGRRIHKQTHRPVGGIYEVCSWGGYPENRHRPIPHASFIIHHLLIGNLYIWKPAVKLSKNNSSNDNFKHPVTVPSLLSQKLHLLQNNQFFMYRSKFLNIIISNKILRVTPKQSGTKETRVEVCKSTGVSLERYCGM